MHEYGSADGLSMKAVLLYTMMPLNLEVTYADTSVLNERSIYVYHLHL